eukprot:1066598-Rhodomonas_salina.2
MPHYAQQHHGPGLSLHAPELGARELSPARAPTSGARRHEAWGYVRRARRKGIAREGRKAPRAGKRSESVGKDIKQRRKTRQAYRMTAGRTHRKGTEHTHTPTTRIERRGEHVATWEGRMRQPVSMCEKHSARGASCSSPPPAMRASGRQLDSCCCCCCWCVVEQDVISVGSTRRLLSDRVG